MPASFGTARGYSAYGGTDVQIDDEIISYRGAAQGSSRLRCWNASRGSGARGAHKAGAKVQRIAERYGWYVADPELAGEIGRDLGRA